MAESSLHETTGRVVAYLKHRATPGARAELRRGITGGLEFYRLAAEILPEGWERKAETWQTLVSAFAMLNPASHQPGKSIGSALAFARFSEPRLNRFLSTPSDLRVAAVQSVARYLSRANVNFDFNELARFALTEDTEKRDNLNVSIASAYFSHPSK